KRQGTDVIFELPVTFAEAALGAEVEVPTLDGKETVKIPAGTQSGRSFRLKGKGVPIVHSANRGDEHVIVKVVTPQTLTTRQRELLKEFSDIEKLQSDKAQHNLFERGFDKIRDAFQ
ncbi:MAG TPA: DnaJ C-terminal domain-containing protein, partial [Ktedonobacterales bacterium]